MKNWASKVSGIIDCHVHMMGGLTREQALLEIREAAGIEQMNLVAIQDPAAGSGLPEAILMKALYPDRFYLFGGLNHAERLTEGRVTGPGLAEQVDLLVAIGCDGVKLIEGKPTSRQKLPVPLDDPYYDGCFARMAELGLPIVWHVNDPEEFWDPARLPAWARERNWGYGPEDVRKEQLYKEVDRVLNRHPDLRPIFAHFYFLSADLDRAAAFMDRNPNACFDLTPGIEMLYNISRDPGRGRRFFLRHADRIVFGTDIQATLTVEEGAIRAGIVYRWLETNDAFRIPAEADFLLGQPEDGQISGMSLPDDVLEAIYRENFIGFAGPTPKPVDADVAIGECRRLARVAEAMSGTPAAETPAAIVADRLIDLASR